MTSAVWNTVWPTGVAQSTCISVTCIRSLAMLFLIPSHAVILWFCGARLNICDVCCGQGLIWHLHWEAWQDPCRWYSLCLHLYRPGKFVCLKTLTHLYILNTGLDPLQVPSQPQVDLQVIMELTKSQLRSFFIVPCFTPSLWPHLSYCTIDIISVW